VEPNPPASPDQSPKRSETMDNVEIYTYPVTQHAFFNDTHPDFSSALVASLSRERTISVSPKLPASWGTALRYRPSHAHIGTITVSK
jgi:dienelactone hydrolase